MERLKKIYTYIRKGKILREQDGFRAKLEKEEEEMIDEIKDEKDGANAATNSTSDGTDEATTLLLNKICEVFRHGPLAFKPNIDKSNSTSLKTSNAGFDTNEETLESDNGYEYCTGPSKFRMEAKNFGYAEVEALKCKGRAEYEAGVNLEGKAASSCSKMQKSYHENETGCEGQIKVLDVDFGAEAHLKAHGKTEVGCMSRKFKKEGEIESSAKVEHKTNITGRYSTCHENGKEETVESDNSYEYRSGPSKFEVQGEMEAKTLGYAEAEILNCKARAEYEAGLYLEGKAESSYRKMQKSYHKKEIGFEEHLEVVEVERRAEAQFRAHGEVGAEVMSWKFKKEGEIQSKAKAEYTTKITKGYSISHEKGKEETIESNNSYEYNSGTCKIEARGELKAESVGSAEAGILNYKVRAEYEADHQLKGKAGSSFRKMQISYQEKEDEIEGHIKVLEAKGKAEAQLRAHGKTEAEVMSRTFTMEGEIESKAKIEGKVIGLEANGYVRQSEIGGKVKVLHAKAKGEASFKAKGSIGKQYVELDAQANAEAKMKVIDGKVCLAVRKEKDGHIHIPGAEFTAGQASAKAEAEFKLKSSTFENKEAKVSAEAKFDSVHVRALGVDAKLEEESKQDFEAKAELDVKGAEVNVLNAKIRGRKKENTNVEAKAKARGFEMNVGNASITGIDETKTARVSVNVGAAAVNAGNVQVAGLGNKGVNMEADLTAGVNIGNIACGINRETGITATSRISFGNVNLTIGPPKLNLGVGFNLGIPFLSGGGCHGSGGVCQGSNGGGGDDKELADGKQNAGETSCNGGSNGSKNGLVSEEGTSLQKSGGSFSSHESRNNRTEHDNTSNSNSTSDGNNHNDFVRSCDATTDEFGSKKLHSTVSNRGDDGAMNNVQGSVPSKGMNGNERIVDQHTSSSNTTSSDSYQNGFAHCDTRCDPETGGFRNTRLESTVGRGNGNDVYGSILQNCTIGPDGNLIPSEENVVIVLEEGNICGVREVVNHFGLPHTGDTWSETSGYEDGSFAGHSSMLHANKACMTATESGGRTMSHSSSRYMQPIGRTMGDVSHRGCDPNAKMNGSDSQRNEGSQDCLEVDKHKKTQNKAPPKTPFGEKKNIHTIFTLNGGDSRPVKYIKGNVACFGDE